jgi:outer membrane protein assembly factor BamB
VTATHFRRTNDTTDEYDWRYETLALSGDDGSQIWSTKHETHSQGYGSGPEMALDRGGNRVIVTGMLPDVDPTPSAFDSVTTRAYSIFDGSQIWEQSYARAQGTIAVDVLVDSGRATAYLIATDIKRGFSRDFRTIAYDSATGAVIWSAAYNSSPEGTSEDNAQDGAISSNGDVFITGVGGDFWDGDYVTIAYDADGT